MSNCSACGAQIGSVSGCSCNYCTGTYCSDHRLPENHFCPGVDNAKTLGPEMRTDKINFAGTGSSPSHDTEMGWFEIALWTVLLPFTLAYVFLRWSLKSWAHFVAGVSMVAIWSYMVLGIAGVL